MNLNEFVERLSREQVQAISAIARDIGQICLASIVIPAFIPWLEFTNIPLVAFGALLMFGMWIISIIIVKHV
jgi:hypothetical protein